MLSIRAIDRHGLLVTRQLFRLRYEFSHVLYCIVVSIVYENSIGQYLRYKLFYVQFFIHSLTTLQFLPRNTMQSAVYVVTRHSVRLA